MKQLIPMDDLGVFIDTKDVAWANSLIVAKTFGKRHDNVMNAIRAILNTKGIDEKDQQEADKFNLLNFKEITYKDEKGRKYPAYAMTRKGFSILVMGFNGAKAMKFKRAYINRFDDMERFIQTLVETRKDFPLLTDNIKMLHENPKPYHFSNECDMINRLVTGMTAKQFREANGLKKGESIRPHLTGEQIWLLNALQKADIGLMISVPSFETRKQHLEWYKQKLLESKQLKGA